MSDQLSQPFAEPFIEAVHGAFRSRIRETQRLTGDRAAAGEDVLRIDLHCHDRNSDQPSVRLGRLLGARETWLESEELLATQVRNGATAHTITNHNNARSCFQLQDAGHDVLVGAEFDCLLEEYGVGLHVLTFGFEPRDEPELARRGKRSVHDFLDYARSRDLVTVLAHPLYYYARHADPIPLEAWERLALLFERFEVLNGQRDCWQNLLAVEWLDAMTPERIDRIAARECISPERFCRDPYVKRFCGGSDDHMGILSGSVGTLVHVPDLKRRLKTSSRAELALEGLRHGQLAPYGGESDPRKMGVAFLDYFCQLVEHLDDPGLVRLLLHRGTAREKLLALGAANAIFELRRHGLTTRFLESFHGALHGRRVGLLREFLTSRRNRPLVGELNEIADSVNGRPEEIHARIDRAVGNIHRHLLRQAAGTLREHSQWLEEHARSNSPADGLKSVFDQLELPLSLRGLLGQEPPHSQRGMTRVPLGKLLDQLSFPVLASGVICTANFASTRSMFDKREFLERFSREYSRFTPPTRAAWLTDTFGDGNGVSMSLRQNLRLIQERDLPVDLVVCSATVEAEPHLVVLPPVGEFEVPFYPDQAVRVPDLLELQRVFVDGAYTRVVSSTEGPMGLAALYLRNAFQVPAYFFMHTDWLAFAEQALGFDQTALDRLKRLLRLYYRGFEGGFCLNREHRAWLTGRDMNLDPRRVHVTHHWLEPGRFRPRAVRREALLPGVGRSTPVLLYVGRISPEKGTGDLPQVLSRVRREHPTARLVAVGQGPAVEPLRGVVPDLIHVPWVEQERLAEYYSAADVLVLPSTFDTFGRVALEALSCGLPVAAYDVKGPREIVEDGVSGFLCRGPSELGERIARYLSSGEQRRGMTVAALERSHRFEPERLMRRFLERLGLPWPKAPGAALHPEPELATG